MGDAHLLMSVQTIVKTVVHIFVPSLFVHMLQATHFKMAPTRGLSTLRALKIKTNKKEKLFGRETFFLPMCTMFCMRKAVTISDGSRIPPSPLGYYNALKT